MIEIRRTIEFLKWMGGLRDGRAKRAIMARARGMSQIAKESGLSRKSLYKALGAEGNPEFGTILKVLQALGLKLSIKPKDAAA